MKGVLALFLLFAVVGSSFGLSITTLSNNTLTPGVLLPPLTGQNFYTPKYYKVFVPINAYQVTIDFSNSDSNSCYYLDWMLSNNIPCDYNINGGTDFLCDDTYTESYISTNSTYVFDITTDETFFQWAVNSFIYISVARNSQDNATCAFTLKTNTQTCAPFFGQTALATETGTCLPYFNATVNVNIPLFNISSFAYYIGAIVVPENTGYLRGKLNATTDNLKLIGSNFGVPTSSNYDCYVPSSNPSGNFYIYDLNCLVPRSGSFYFVLFNIAGIPEYYNLTLSLEVDTCAPALGGYNCTDTVSQFNANTDDGRSFSLAPSTSRYFYLDFPAGQGQSFSINATTNLTGVYFGIRKDGFFYDVPDYSEGQGYEDSDEYEYMYTSSVLTKNLAPEDTYTGGRWYFGVANPTLLPASFTLSSMAIIPTEAPTQATGTPTQGQQSSHHASATLCMPSFLVAAFLAMLALL